MVPLRGGDLTTSGPRGVCGFARPCAGQALVAVVLPYIFRRVLEARDPTETKKV